MYTFVDKLARCSAVLGGIVLSAMIVLTCLSILGRSLNSLLHGDFVQSIAPQVASAILDSGVGAINGDFELVEAGMAFAIFAFLPLCQLNSAHASVDLFTSWLPDSVNRILRMLIELIFAAVLLLIAVQLFTGMLSKQASGQTTFLIQYPLWWAYAASVAGAIVAAFVAVYVAIVRLWEILTGQRILPSEIEAEH